VALPVRLRKFSRVVRQTVLPGDGQIGAGERFLATALRFLVQMGRQFVRDRCPRQAAALAFQTLLAIVPLGAVLLALTRWTEALGDRPAVTRLLERFVLPSAAQDLADKLSGIVERIDLQAIGWIGGATLVVVGGLLILQVEDVLNDMWNVARARSLWERIAGLFAFTLLALPAFAAAVYLSVERLASPWDRIVPALLALTALTVIYKLLPHVRVRWRSALAGAIVATLLLGAGHELFGVYVDWFGWTWESVYGAIAFVPIACFWMWMAWLFFLLGAEVSYTSQHLDVLWLRAKHARELAGAGADVVRATSWTNAVRVAAGVAAAEAAGRAPLDAEFLAIDLRVPVDAVELLGSRLVAGGVLCRDPEGRFSLARPAARIPLADVHDAVTDLRALPAPLLPIVDRQREALRGRTVADLLGSPPGLSPES
jgi:membrane protein